MADRRHAGDRPGDDPGAAAADPGARPRHLLAGAAGPLRDGRRLRPRGRGDPPRPLPAGRERDRFAARRRAGTGAGAAGTAARLVHALAGADRQLRRDRRALHVGGRLRHGRAKRPGMGGDLRAADLGAILRRAGDVPGRRRCDRRGRGGRLEGVRAAPPDRGGLAGRAQAAGTARHRRREPPPGEGAAARARSRARARRRPRRGQRVHDRGRRRQARIRAGKGGVRRGGGERRICADPRPDRRAAALERALPGVDAALGRRRGAGAARPGRARLPGQPARPAAQAGHLPVAVGGVPDRRPA